MKIFTRISVIIAVLVAWLSPIASAVTPVAQEADEPIIIVFKNGTAAWKKDVVHGLVGGKRKKDRGELSVINAQVVHVTKGRRAAMLAQYRRDDSVMIAEVDSLLTPAVTPNDPSYSGQWHLPKIQAPTAWNTTKGSSSLIIAICDTGVDPNHPDLKNKLLAGYNSDDGSTNWSDIHGHGTAVAGTAAAIGNNGTFGTGVAWDCKILPVRITNATNGVAYMSKMAAGITWAADHGAKVINLSYQTYANGALSATVLSACRYAESKGAVVVIAAGNENTNPAGTGDPSEAIYVSAVGSTDVKSSFSNYGLYVDIASPGQSIYTTNKGGGYGGWSGTSFAAPVVSGVMALIFSANPSLSVADAKQILFSNADNIGTSTYYGAGRVNAGNAVQAAGGFDVNQPPVLTVQEPLNNSTYLTTDLVTFRASATDAEDGNVTSRIVWVSNRDGALGNGGSFSDYLSAGTHTITVQVTDLNGQMTTTTITVVVNIPQSITAPSNLASTAATLSVTLTWTDNSTNETGFSIERAVQASAPIYSVIAVVSANVKTYKDTAPSYGTYLYRVRAYNSQTTSSYSNTVTVTLTSPNQPPVLTIVSPSNNATVLTTTVVTFSGTATDPENGILSSSILWRDNGAFLGFGASCTAQLTAGTHVISAFVADNLGLNVTKTITVTATAPANQPPALAITSPTNLAQFTNSQTVAFSAQAIDPEDGDISSQIVWKLGSTTIGNGASCSVLLPSGTHFITASVTDSSGATTSSSITITVNEANSLAAPTNLFGRTTYVEALQARLYWKDNSNGTADGFILEYALVPADGSQPQFAEAATLPLTACKRYVDTRATAGTYLYRVRAFKGSQLSDYSNVIQLNVK